MAGEVKYWVIIPAAGVGNRMETSAPKQYLKLNNRCILEHVVSLFLDLPVIEGVVVVISKNDSYWPNLELSGHEKVTSTTGGKERYHSVLNGLRHLKGIASEIDWVLVHDAARPCVRRNDITALIEGLSNHPVGGLLGSPVRDTMKRVNTGNEIVETVSRENLWHALTPQMFRLGELQTAIEKAITNNVKITDEAEAMERAGFRPILVRGNPDNIKITHRSDMPLAELYLLQQENEE